MKAEERKINQILTEEIRYEIPAYQRPYSWEKDNVEQLLEDIWEAFEANDEEYFIGSLITIEHERDQLYEVVDGQQRLTTLNLIFARLRDAVGEPARSALGLGQRVLLRNAQTDFEEIPRLTLRKCEQKFFRKYVLDAVEIPETKRKEIDKEKDTPKLRIIENLEIIDAFIKTRKTQRILENFTNFLLTKVYVVFVTTASWRSAYRLFNVLNARGMQLSNADLIKNELFAHLGNDMARSTELEDEWLTLEKQVGIESLDQFLGHHRSSVMARKPDKSLHEEYKPMIMEAETPFAFLGDLKNSAENYQRIIQNEFKDDMATWRAVRSLHWVKFKEWIPPLLAFLNKPVNGMPEQEFIDLLERITYQNWVRRLGFTARLTVYFQLINAIRAGKSAEDVRNIFRESANNREFRNLLDGDIHGKQFAKAVLLRLEEADQDESVTKDYSGRITIEHVLPQALKDNYWKERFTEEDHLEWLHRLGNLTLLSASKNGKAQYYSFERKKNIYSERNNKTSFDLTKRIIDEDNWDVDAIKRRQDEMMETAERIWRIG